MSDTGLAPLRLPGGDTIEIVGDSADLSVFGALVASGGDWEPHVRLLLERLVQPDWVCLDIGANIGAHTLTLATLASSGRVVAFEASETNQRYLARNANRANVSCVQTALWDRPGTLQFEEIDELGGCSHITMREPSDDGQAYLRSVIPADVLAK